MEQSTAHLGDLEKPPSESGSPALSSPGTPPEKSSLGDTKVDIAPEPATAKSKAKKDRDGGYRYYVQLWKYAAPVDVALRVLGFFAACGAGSALPLMTIVFGSLINDFNSFNSSSGMADAARGSDGDRLRASINKNVLWFVYLFVGKFTLVYIHTCCFSITAIRATKAIRQEYISSLLRQDIAYFDTCTPGSVATSISNNADLIQNGMSEKVGTIIQGLAMLVAAFVVAFTHQWKLTLVTATTLPGAVAAVGVTLALDARLESKILAIYAQAGGLVEEALGSVRIVTAFAANEKLTQKYETYLEVAKKFGVKKGPVLGVMYSSEFSLMYCAYSLCFWYGVKLLMKSEISNVGTIITVLFSCVIATSAITLIAPSFGDIAKAAAASKAVLDLIDQVPTIDPISEDGEKPAEVSGTIEFRAVSFAYPARPTLNVLDDLSLTFPSSKVTAIVGASGSGKSTVIGLMERWYDPMEGVVTFDGRDIRKLNLRWLRSQIGLVQQEPVLFNSTIYENVVHGLYGTAADALPEDEKRELVQAACVEANCDQFIQELPEAYDTKVGERAGFLSGGQKQRIAIARSIISDPKVLLLDEATSALDPKSEGIVQKALDRVSQSQTTIMIAHKLSTVQKADKILVMNQGRVVEEGTHDSLLAAKGAYSRLVNAQNLGSDDTDEIETQAELELTQIQTTKSVASVKSAVKSENVSRKMSLFKCLIIIFKEQRQHWQLLLAGGIMSALAGGVFPAQAVLFAKIVTVFSLPKDQLQSRANFWALMYFVLALGTLVTYASLGFFLTVAAFLISRYYRGEYFAAMLRQDISFYDLDSNSSGALTARLSSDPQRLQDLISANLGLIVIVLVNLLSTCTLALVIGWKLALVAISGSLPLLFFAGFMRTRLEAQSQDRNAALYAESARFAAEAVGAIRTVSSLTLESKVRDNYGHRLNLSVQKSYKHTAISMLLFGLSDSLDLVAMALAFWYGGRLLVSGEYTPVDFFTVFIALIFGGQAAGFLFGYTLNTTKAHAAANQILHLRKQRPPINTSTGAAFASTLQNATKETSTIEFKDVRFSYPTRPELPVLRGLNLTVYPGQTIGVVGASGCGKTTIITLLERFYDIASGQILIHGQPLSSLDVKDYRANVGLVSQDTTLYQGSLKENILLGLGTDEEDPDDERLIAACAAANIHTFISSLPDGYETQAGSRGLALSGGQRQRIAIARALVRDPSILLLDEATSALDTQSEEVVQKALETAAKGRTVVAVAHRLSTIRGADCIFVLDAGRVVEAGTHSELVRKRGSYWNMVQAQSLDREAK